MFGDPEVVGEEQAFKWDVLDDALSGSSSRNMHAIWRVILHFPGQDLKVPQYLIDAGIQLHSYSGGVSPDYSDPKLLKALDQFIFRLGNRYDGDKRLGFVQAGLLGFWGEWHTHTSGSDKLNLTDESKKKVVDWYSSAFKETQIQVRHAFEPAFEAGFGLHDDAFGYSTLDGDANGGVIREWYFWPEILSSGRGDVWESAPIGGETWPSWQHYIFEDAYPSRTYQHQDFMECTEVTHATYIFHHQAFKNGGFKGSELQNARYAHARMGYNYFVSEVSAFVTSDSTVSVAVKLSQIGVAPFYYSLGLAIECAGMSKYTIWGVDALAAKDSSDTFNFSNLPARAACLDKVQLSLESPYLYPGRPMKFAQSDGQVVFSIPWPNLPTQPQTPPPPPPPSPQAENGQRPITFKLIHVPEKTVVMDLYDGAVVNPSELGVTTQFNVEAFAGDDVTSIKFEESQVTASAPSSFYYCGFWHDWPRTCDDLIPSSQQQTITAIPYVGTSSFPPTTIKFTITQPKSPPPPPSSLPPPSPQAENGQRPITFKLIHVPGKTVVMDLYDGTVVDTSELGVSAEFNVEAFAGDDVTSIKFEESQVTGSAQSSFYYCGFWYDWPRTCEDLIPSSQQKTITAIPYVGTSSFPPASINFTIS